MMKININVFVGRPAEKRTDTEETIYDFLDGINVGYDRADHEPTNTMGDCAAVGDVLGIRICKNLLLCNRQKSAFYLLLMPGDKEFRTKNLSAQIGSSRLSFADSDAMQQLISAQPGSASILGLLFDKDNKIRLLIDSDVLREEYFGCHPCKNTSSLKIKTSDLTGTVIPALGHEPSIVTL